VANKRKALNEMVERQAAEVAEELAHGFANWVCFVSRWLSAAYEAPSFISCWLSRV
jgi:hypothetical protein